MEEAMASMFVQPELFGCRNETGGALDCSDGYGFFQLFFHAAVYGYVLFQASNLISEGSELLLLTPYRDIIGSVILPILGAVPDGAIIFFSSGATIPVGVGALAGSTIMLLTVPWALALMAGRVNLDANGVPTYAGKPQDRCKPGSFFSQLRSTGCTVDDSIKRAAIFMVVTSISYIIIQAPGFKFDCQEKDCGCTGTAEQVSACLSSKADDERPFIVCGLVVAILLFVAYIVDAFRQTSEDDQGKQERKMEEICKKAISKGVSINFIMFLSQGVKKSRMPCCGGDDEEQVALMTDDRQKFSKACHRLFLKYNTDNKGGSQEVIDESEVTVLLHDLHMHNSQLAKSLRAAADSHHKLTAKTFEDLCWKYAQNGSTVTPIVPPLEPPTKRREHDEESNASDDDDELEELPEGLEGMTYEQQQREIWKRALTQMAVGTVLVLLFSDPMCDILGNIGTRINVNPFYVSFVLAPLASNASELVAAYGYAAKKTIKTMSISISTLLGAACMNNTFCLAIFLAKIATANDLVWQFSAETIAILFIEFFMFFFAISPHFKSISAVFIGLAFPLSILLVWFLENVVGFD
eukprot:TRINITY_DN22274_c0_g1_i1.p2 TRINITY_DN22274_c0_g1~~TRINITY_DN22274_c0_g1_i1.p2  ORF type:complete len:581 (+),score=255.35 TRINITY_DN22274_c0_g1_i1:55-1797(+)